MLSPWHTRSDYDNFWQKCYWESKKSEDALFSHLTNLVLLHYLAKEETLKYWCIVYATQSNFCSALNFTYPEPRSQQPRDERIGLLRESYSSVSMSRESKRLKKSNSWLNSGNVLIQHLSKMRFSCFPVLPGSTEAQVIWDGIVKHLLIAYLIGNISAKKNIKIRSRVSNLLFFKLLYLCVLLFCATCLVKKDVYINLMNMRLKWAQSLSAGCSTSNIQVCSIMTKSESNR